MRFPNKLDRYRDARDAYFHGGKTQKEIAIEVGITDRTLRNWIKEGSWQRLRQNANLVPAIMLDSYCSQLMEIQSTIAKRPDDERLPQPSEIEMQRKLLNCIINMKKYPSEMFKTLAYGITTVSDELPESLGEQTIPETAQENLYKTTESLLAHYTPQAENIVVKKLQTIDNNAIIENIEQEKSGNKAEKSGNKIGNNPSFEIEKIASSQQIPKQQNTVSFHQQINNNTLLVPSGKKDTSPDIKRRIDEINRILINDFHLFPLGDNFLWDKQKQVERHLTDKEWEILSNNGFTYEQIKSALYRLPAA